MKISEARNLYQNQLSAYQEQRQLIQDQLNKLKENNGDDLTGQAAVLELSLQKLTDKENEYQSYLGILAEQKNKIAGFASAKQQGDSMAEAAEDMGKIMLTARRIMQGGTVPIEDEQKLMEFDKDLWLMAKSAGALAKKREEYDTLWEEKQKAEAEDPDDIADNSLAAGGAPERVSTDSLIAEATAEISGGEG